MSKCNWHSDVFPMSQKMHRIWERWTRWREWNVSHLDAWDVQFLSRQNVQTHCCDMTYLSPIRQNECSEINPTRSTDWRLIHQAAANGSYWARYCDGIRLCQTHQSALYGRFLTHLNAEIVRRAEETGRNSSTVSTCNKVQQFLFFRNVH